jgi:hypothetical protein
MILKGDFKSKYWLFYFRLFFDHFLAEFILKKSLKLAKIEV